MCIAKKKWTNFDTEKIAFLFILQKAQNNRLKHIGVLQRKKETYNPNREHLSGHPK